MKSRIHIRIFGEVQGVFFRAGAQEEARKLGVGGYVKNLEDGSVEVVAEGEVDKLESLLEWCMHGPDGASVTHCEYEWLPKTDEFRGFNIG